MIDIKDPETELLICTYYGGDVYVKNIYGQFEVPLYGWTLEQARAVGKAAIAEMIMKEWRETAKKEEEAQRRARNTYVLSKCPDWALKACPKLGVQYTIHLPGDWYHRADGSNTQKEYRKGRAKVERQFGRTTSGLPKSRVYIEFINDITEEG